MKNKLMLIAALLLTSCISVKHHQVPEIKNSDLQFSSAKKTKIFITWKADSHMPISDKSFSKTQEKILREVIAKLDCCEIVYDQKDAKVIIDGRLSNQSEPLALAASLLTGASLYIIPSWMNIKQHISATVIKNKKTYNYNLDDSSLFAQWLFFIFAMPFRENPMGTESKVTENLYRNLFLQMKNDGLFNN